jgi:hypothetical protein
VGRSALVRIVELPLPFAVVADRLSEAPEYCMDILVMLDDAAEDSSLLAHVNTVPASPHASVASRDVVTLYGAPNADSLALALAAAVESHRTARPAEAIGHLGIWPERGAVGDEAWHDDTGTLVSRDLEIPLEILHSTAKQLLSEFGQVIRKLVAGLSMPDWPEGARRAITVSLSPIAELTAPVFAPLDIMFERLREADALAFDMEGE